MTANCRDSFTELKITSRTDPSETEPKGSVFHLRNDEYTGGIGMNAMYERWLNRCKDEELLAELQKR